MRFSHKIIFALHLVGLPLLSTHASAQIFLGNGVTVTKTNTQSVISGAESIDLGTSATTGWVTQMPMSLSYGATNVAISFGANSGVYAGNNPVVASSGWGNTAFFAARTGAGVTMDFSATQNYFSAAWGSPDIGNQLQFYNGANLVASMTGQQFMSGGSTAYAEFSFAEAGFTRVVATTASGAFELAQVSFDDVAPAPIPLNAASLGGLMSFLMMLAMRGKGGTQVMVRMAFASLMPRRRGMA